MAGPGDLVVKPRGIWHAVWNAGDEPPDCSRSSPRAGFGRYFAELAPLFPPQAPEPDFAGMSEVQARYGLTVDLESVERLVAEHGLTVEGRARVSVGFGLSHSLGRSLARGQVVRRPLRAFAQARGHEQRRAPEREQALAERPARKANENQ